MSWEEEIVSELSAGMATTEKGLRRAASEALLSVIREDTAAGLLADGRRVSFDLRDTGELMGTATASEEGVTFPAKHAEAVNARHPYLGVAPASRDKLHRRIQEAAEKAPTR